MINLDTSMKKTKTVIFFCLVLQTVSSYKLTCPSVGQWSHRARVCINPNKYICLLETVKDIYVESCRGPRLEVDGFQTTINKENFDKIKCSSKRYQPLTFTTEGNSECVFQKSMCSEEGQIVYDPNDVSTESDRGCICNFIEGYALISPEKNRCFCVPSNVTDCSCYKKTCASDEVLTQDYKCVRKVQIGYDLEDNKCKKIIRIGITDTEDDYKKEKVNNYEKIILKGSHTDAGIAVLLLLIMIVMCPLVWLFFKERRRRKEKVKENMSSESDSEYHDALENLPGKNSIDKSLDKSPDERRSDTQSSTENITHKTFEGTVPDRSSNENRQNDKIVSKFSAYVTEETCTSDYLQNDDTSTNDITLSNIEVNRVSNYPTDNSGFKHPTQRTESSKIENENGARNYDDKLTDTQRPRENVQSTLDTTGGQNLESNNETDNTVINTERGNSDFKLEKNVVEDSSDEQNKVLDMNTIDKANPGDMKDTTKLQCDTEAIKVKHKQEKTSDEDSCVNDELNETSTVAEKELPTNGKDREIFLQETNKRFENILQFEKEPTGADGDEHDKDDDKGDDEDCKEHRENKEGEKGS